MTLALGCLLAAGLLLVASPFLWPSRERAAVAARAGVQTRMRSRLTQAGFGGVPVSVFIAVSLAVGLASAALAQAMLGVQALAAVAGLAAMVFPSLLVSWRARARRRANRTVWPDVVDHLVSAVRSGLALPDSVSSLAQSGPAAGRIAFSTFEREYRATGNFAHCIDELKASLSDPIADRILETLRMARDVGGSDLTIVLRSLAAWLRQDAAIRSEVEARQSWIVNSARLGVAAPWIVLLLLASRPEAALAYNTPAGGMVILGGLVVSALAYRVMVRLGRLPEERRWFR
ncbi:type II secretion system protein F [Cryobacterium sp. Sr8]|uniref:Tight adherence protein B n=1 Tax=Cryobacterium psychrotolerans TaxID=386301 RepID=A0A1G9HCY5_9MICO|nr:MULTISPECIES: type II secretion system F family protein [Cryobacterium]TFD42596.1 type II secretion system protein F [Cryobacterium sp. TMT1-2-1]TFD80745.1 type II secretion system protein F [Cryobacterium sp. Sr8]TFD83262.1 type II secretion system protein F [Cryobacterium psychrotolerans]SDL10881.1 tight adherence protein B [Cryobacterium psychrotolerans]